MSFIVMNILNPDDDDFEESKSQCSKCQSSERNKDLQKLGQEEYCSPCYNETIREIAATIPGVVPQLEIIK